MAPDLRLAHTGVTTTGQRVDVSVQPEGRHHKGRVLRWHGGVYDVELPDADALKLLHPSDMRGRWHLRPRMKGMLPALLPVHGPSQT